MYYATPMRVPGNKAHSSQIAQMCRAFAASGVDIDLLVAARRSYGSETVSEFYGFDRPVRREQIPTIDVLTRLRAGAPRPLVKAAHRLFVAGYKWNLVKRLKQVEKEFVIFTRDTATVSAALRLVPPQRVCLELHMLPDPNNRKGLLERVDTVKALGGCIVVTRGMREQLVRAGVAADSVLVKPNAIDLRTFPGSVDVHQARRTLGLPPHRKILMFTGNVTAMGTSRGLETLLQAGKLLADRGQDVCVCIIGAVGDEMDRLRKESGHCGLQESRLVVVERQPYERLHLWMSAADILVHPLPEHRIYSELTSPLKIFEYRTSGRPIVASDLPAIRELLEDGRDALLARPGDPESFASAMERLLEDPGMASSIAQRALAKAGNWTWEARAAEILEWIETRLAPRSVGKPGTAGHPVHVPSAGFRSGKLP